MASSGPRWKIAITTALAEYPRATIIQLATLDPTSPRPHVRSHVFRNFITPSENPLLPLLMTTTDIRTPKVSQIISNPHVELAWWIEGKKEQYRISGLTCIIPAPEHPLYNPFLHTLSSSPSGTGFEALSRSKLDWEAKRLELFRSLSSHMRASWCRPVPGSPLIDGEAEKWPETVSEPQEGPDYEKQKMYWEMALKNFALVIIDPSEVDYVEMDMIPNRRWKFTRTATGTWDEIAVIP